MSREQIRGARRLISHAAAALVLLGFPLQAAPAEDLVKAALAAEARMDSARALELFLQADALKPNDAFILQKIATQYSDQVPDRPDVAAQRDFAQRALAYAKRAVAIEPRNAVNILSLAICHGRLAVTSDTRTRVELSRVIKQEAERALALDPGYAWAHHVLGRWHHEVAAFGPPARFFARLFYGGLPAASTAEAVNHLQRATELEPQELTHWLELGFACAAAGRRADARAAWEHGLAMPDRRKHDAPAKSRAREALAALN